MTSGTGLRRCRAFVLCLLVSAGCSASKTETWSYELTDIDGNATMRFPRQKFAITLAGVSSGTTVETGTITVGGIGTTHSESSAGKLKWTADYYNNICMLAFNGYDVRIDSRAAIVTIFERRIKVDGATEVRAVITGDRTLVIEPAEAELH